MAGLDRSAYWLRSYDKLAKSILSKPPRLGPVRLIAIDGPSGSGKTFFAKCLAASFSRHHVATPILHTDDLLEGWEDQITFWGRYEEWILSPLRHGNKARFRAYDWISECRSSEWQEIPVSPVLITEGVTTSRADIRNELTITIFMVAPAAMRLKRAISRDGPQISPYMQKWQEGERKFFNFDATFSRADLTIYGADVDMPYDPLTQYVEISPELAQALTLAPDTSS